MLQAHVTEHHQSVAGLDGVDNSHIFTYISLTLKSFLPFKDRRRRQIHLRGQFFGGQIGILLQFTQNKYVDTVQCFHKSIFCPEKGAFPRMKLRLIHALSGKTR